MLADFYAHRLSRPVDRSACATTGPWPAKALPAQLTPRLRCFLGWGSRRLLEE